VTMDRYERLLAAQGFTRVAGADEAGRGALAGPLVAAAVILPVDFDIEGINDSKVLSEAHLVREVEAAFRLDHVREHREDVAVLPLELELALLFEPLDVVVAHHGSASHA